MVADFGIALALSAAAGGRMTETGLSLGTPHYMSPEQATAEKEISGRSDVYSLGSVLYEMLTGDPPHTGSSAQQIILKIVTDTARPVTELRKAVPPNVAAAVAKSLEKLPADRFATAREFAEALTNPGFTTAAVGMAGGAAPGAGSWLRDRRTQATLALTALAVATLAWSLTRMTGMPGPSEYDVALPDSAAMGGLGFWRGFAVSPAGDFLVYKTVGAGPGTLWYRSLLDGAARPIPGTENAIQPSIATGGDRVAFIRDRGEDWTLETISPAGGESVTL
jgi:serine/threonine-protein kinase